MRGSKGAGQIVGLGTFNGRPAVFRLTPSGAPPDPTPPQVRECRVDPAQLPTGGGLATVTARVTDNVRVASVVAEVQPPKGRAVPGSHEPRVARGDVYVGQFSVPAGNYRAEARGFDARRTLVDTAAGTAMLQPRVASTLTLEWRRSKKVMRVVAPPPRR